VSIATAASRPEALQPDSVGTTLKRMPGRAGPNPTSYAEHSLWARFATQPAVDRATKLEIMRQNRASLAGHAAAYIREGQLFRSFARINAPPKPVIDAVQPPMSVNGAKCKIEEEEGSQNGPETPRS
jgi:hypothetical protein